MITRITRWFEQQAFGVCEWLGQKLGINTTTVRMYFIYLSFFTFGSPVIIYFILAFFSRKQKILQAFFSEKTSQCLGY